MAASISPNVMFSLAASTSSVVEHGVLGSHAMLHIGVKCSTEVESLDSIKVSTAYVPLSAKLSPTNVLLFRGHI